MTTQNLVTDATIYNNGYLPGVDAVWDRIVQGVRKWIPGYYPGCTLRVVKLPVDFTWRKEALGECFVSATNRDTMVAVLEDMEEDQRFCAIDPNNTYAINYRRDNFEVVTQLTTIDNSTLPAIGDTVVVVEGGHTYNSYTDMFRAAGFVNTDENDAFEDGTIAHVWWVGQHGTWPEITIYALRDKEGRECLIGLDGIRKAECDGVVFSLRIDSPGVSYNHSNRTFKVKRPDLWKEVLQRTDRNCTFVIHNPNSQRCATFAYQGMHVADTTSFSFFSEPYQIHMALEP